MLMVAKLQQSSCICKFGALQTLCQYILVTNEDEGVAYLYAFYLRKFVLDNDYRGLNKHFKQGQCIRYVKCYPCKKIKSR